MIELHLKIELCSTALRLTVNPACSSASNVYAFTYQSVEIDGKPDFALMTYEVDGDVILAHLEVSLFR
ncbi:hypothetical protein DPMN_018432 [Dreissena polymorpha]|uniref:Uncharacterized protein n=1 Tax=Dreissena polymorpha TaxID=45954 RepID=A0A9D4NF41_DREPO|nr:hypothetical protein DPMN_018432 [Dreissena polymorpha]